MPYAEIIKAALALAGVAIVVIIALWHNILDWAKSSLFPWIEKNLPTIVDAVKDAFTWVDNNVAVPIRRLVKAAWNKLRNYLLKMVTRFDRKTQSTWVKQATSWVIEVLDSPKPTVKKVETVEEVNWDDLPADVKNAWLKNNQSSRELNVTEARDQELGALSMTN